MIRFFYLCCFLQVAILTDSGFPRQAEKQIHPGTVTVSFDSRHPANIINPLRALGAGIDGHEKGDLARMLRQANIKEMLSAGLRPLTYRLRTELGVEAWHWNSQGQWSDPVHQQGYWTSDSISEKPVIYSYGYRLPRRGNTIDQADNDGYSRLDDGDAKTFWKSNPYLDEHFTHEKNSLHPQWVVIDFEKTVEINAVQIHWANPYATRYEVEYGLEKVANEFLPRKWLKFPEGGIVNGGGGNSLLRLSQKPLATRFIRILMIEGSSSTTSATPDIRDRLGYAIREISAGLIDPTGRFRDHVRHSPTLAGQTICYTSSTDPWHRAIDLDRHLEQIGFDWIFRTGLTNQIPMLTPVSLVYDTPENAAAEIRFLKSRSYPVERIEMGEEPDGQLMSPEDYSALYIQWAEAIHQVDPDMKTGGPCFASIEGVSLTDPDKPNTTEWIRRFFTQLKDHHHSGDFNFFSFEWYPFDEVCNPTAPQLIAAPEMLSKALAEIKKILPANFPMLITEYGYSAFAGEAEVSIEGALLNAETVGMFLTLGGEQAYLYGYEPNELISELSCSWGNNMLFMMNRQGRITHRLATYWGARMMTQDWAKPVDSKLEIHPASTDVLDGKGRQMVTAYAIHQPAGGWSIMLINKDPQKAYAMRVQTMDEHGVKTLMRLNHIVQYSKEQYIWHPARELGYPIVNIPPRRWIVVEGKDDPVILPPYSLTQIACAARFSPIR